MQIPGRVEALLTPGAALASRMSPGIVAPRVVGEIGEDIDHIAQWHMAGWHDPEQPGWEVIDGNANLDSGALPKDFTTSSVFQVRRDRLDLEMEQRGYEAPALAYVIPRGRLVIAAAVPDSGREQLEFAMREGPRDALMAVGGLKRVLGVHRFMPSRWAEVVARRMPNQEVREHHPNAIRV